MSTDLKPADAVRAAVDKLRSDSVAVDPEHDEHLAELLEHIADEMGDDDAVEQHFPEHIPERRVMVCDYQGEANFVWTAALATARVILGETSGQAT